MNPVMYIFINKGLGMSPGKIAAQAAHAACLAMYNEIDYAFKKDGEINHLFEYWWNSGHYTKFVMEVPDAETIDAVERYLNERDFETYMVVDEGRTEDTYFKKTAMATQIVDKDDSRTRSIFDNFKLYRD